MGGRQSLAAAAALVAAAAAVAGAAMALQLTRVQRSSLHSEELEAGKMCKEKLMAPRTRGRPSSL